VEDRRYQTEKEPETGERVDPRTSPFTEFSGPRRSEEMRPTYYGQEYPLTREHNLAARGFCQSFGLHPGMAFLTLVVDSMVFGGTLVSGGLLLPVAFGAAAVLGIIVYMAQRAWYGDDDRNALIKALIVGLLTAIPSPLPYVLFVPAGLLGFFRRKRG